MNDLIEAINYYERIKGREQLKLLVTAGVIESFKPCPDECCVRRGGLFHAKDCENECNHSVYRDRTEKARQKLTHGLPGGQIHDGYWDASVSLVGK